MYRLVYVSKRINANANAEYDLEKKQFIVKKGSIVSDKVCYSEKFKAAYKIEEQRKKYVKEGVVLEDVLFSSPSTAANFVTGRSTNGLIAWKDEKGLSLKKILENK